MNRRDHLKSLGAFLVGGGLMKPFRVPADQRHPPADHIQKAQLRLRLHTDPIHELEAYRSALLGPGGELWRGPRVLNVYRNPSGTPIFFHMQPLEAQETFTTHAIRLYHPSGEWRAESLWKCGPVTLQPGDQLNANLDFNLLL